MVKIQTNSNGKVYVSNGKVLLAAESGGEFQLERIKDDSNNEIGTAFMIFTDGNGNKFKVVCLDAQYRLEYGVWCSEYSYAITDLPMYSNLSVYSTTETATYNTQKILDYCTSGGYTSSACSHCRSKSFTIGGTTYYGQLPNIIEGFNIIKNRNEINTLDPTANNYPVLVIPTYNNFWVSNQYVSQSSIRAWNFLATGAIGWAAFDEGRFTIPVIEIPI